MHDKDAINSFCMHGDGRLYRILEELNIPFEYHEHPAAPTVEIASRYWKNIESTHCKNIFLRNHKGNKHFLIVLDYRKNLSIREIEQFLKQGKLTFASPERMKKYLGLEPGSVSPFGLINDSENHVHIFLDENLKHSEKISFHPCVNTASIVISYNDFLRFLAWTENTWEYFKLY